MRRGKLKIATCQFAVSPSIRRNSGMIQRQMRLAKRKKADIVHFPECALSGYGGQEVKSWKGYDWELLRDETRSIMALAGRLRQWVVLGSSHYLGEGKLPHNCLYLIGPGGRIRDRYDKRFCTRPGLKYYSPGGHSTIFRVNGVRCGLMICYDIRFPELHREYKRLGAQLVLHSFYNARSKGAGIWTVIMRPSLQAMAATNYFWVSGNNSSAYYGLWPSVFILPDGRIAKKLRFHRAGVMVNTVDTAKKFYDASAPYRDDAMRGVLHSGKLVASRRSRNRKCL